MAKKTLYVIVDEDTEYGYIAESKQEAIRRVQDSVAQGEPTESVRVFRVFEEFKVKADVELEPVK